MLFITIIEGRKVEENGTSAGPNNGALSRASTSVSSASNTPQSKLCLPIGGGTHGRGQTLRDLLASIPGFSMKVSELISLSSLPCVCPELQISLFKSTACYFNNDPGFSAMSDISVRKQSGTNRYP